MTATIIPFPQRERVPEVFFYSDVEVAGWFVWPHEATDPVGPFDTLTIALDTVAVDRARVHRMPMRRIMACVAFALSIVASQTALAAEKTVTLAVTNMYCADCPFIVKKSLEHVPGVANVTVSYKDKTAVVTFDDSKTNVHGLTAATTNAGYPSKPKS